MAKKPCRFAQSEKGTVAIVSAFVLSISLLLAAFAVDYGMLTLERREAQHMADMAAITAAANISNAERAARLALEDNGFANVVIHMDSWAEPEDVPLPSAGKRPTELLLERGRYAADASRAPHLRFEFGGEPQNAVRVTMRKEGQLYFAHRLLPAPMIETRGMAQASGRAAFSIGSRLARLDGGVLNSVLGGLTGSSISLTVMDYNALINADVALMPFMHALAGEANITAGTYQDVLDSNIRMGRFFHVLAGLYGAGTGPRVALEKLARDAGHSTVEVPLDALIDLGHVGKLALGHTDAAMDATLGLMQLISAAGALANGDNQIRLDIGAQVPGLLSLTLDLAIGEPMQESAFLAVGEDKAVVRTAQTRALFEALVAGSGVLSGIAVRLPIYLELAYAEASLESLHCPQGRPDQARVRLAARPGVADLWLADVTPAQLSGSGNGSPPKKASIVNAPLIKVEGLAHVELGNTSPTMVDFSHADIMAGRIKTVSTRNAIGSVTGSLLRDLRLDVRVTGIGIGLPGLVSQAVIGVLEPVAAPLDEVIFATLALLGVKVGEADVRVNGIRCGAAVLVQ